MSVVFQSPAKSSRHQHKSPSFGSLFMFPPSVSEMYFGTNAFHYDLRELLRLRKHTAYYINVQFYNKLYSWSRLYFIFGPIKRQACSNKTGFIVKNFHTSARFCIILIGHINERFIIQKQCLLRFGLLCRYSTREKER